MNFNDLFQYKDLDMFYCDIDAERERGLLINEDCMKVLKQLDDNSVDLTLTDIPYGEVNRASSGLRNFDKGDADIVTFIELQKALLLYFVVKNSFRLSEIGLQIDRT